MNSEDLRPYYDWHITDQVFTPDRIERQGRYLLKRALNVGRVVAFVGSGVPAAYGRPTWSELVDRAEKRAERSPDNDGLGHLHKQMLGALKKAGGGPGSDPDLLPLRAHLISLRGADADGQSIFDSVVKQKTMGDAAGLGALMADVLGEAAEAAGEHILDRKLIEAVLANGLKRTPAIASAIGKGKGRLNAEEVAALQLTRASFPDKLKKRDPGAGGGAGKDWKKQPRRHLQHDPVHKIYEKLRLRRIVTTNYDVELERALDDVGFEYGSLWPDPHAHRQPPDDGRFTSSNGRGASARASVLKLATAADLVDLAGGQSDFAYDIFHLHGRAGPADPIVATERQYQETYLRYTPQRHVMSEALRMLFAGNPILFIGLGMREADILRPLRRFMSDPEIQSNRSIFALMPAEDSYPLRCRNALQLYLRYGVHTLYYGADWKRGADSWAKTFKPKEALAWSDRNWRGADGALCSALKRLRKLQKLFSGNSKAKLLDDLNIVVANAPPQEAPEQEANAWRSGVLLSVLGPAFCDIGLNCGWLAEDKSYAKDGGIGRLVAVKDNVIGAALADLPGVLLEVAQARRANALPHLKAFFGQLWGRVLTASLSVALDEVERQRRDWWADWKRIPRSRDLAMHPMSRKGDEWVLLDRWEQDGDHQTIKAVRYGLTRSPTKTTSQQAPSISALLREHFTNGPDASATSEGRRVVLLAGGKGAGKGSAFHDLEWDLMQDGDERWAAGVFANAAFSTEYASVIEGVIGFLDKARSRFLAQKPDTGAQDELEPARDGTQSRAIRLKASLTKTMRALRDLSSADDDRPKRLLLVFSGIEMLFREDGTPKNRALAEALAVLLEPEVDESWPLDVVFICRDDRVFSIFLSEEAIDRQRTSLAVMVDQNGGRARAASDSVRNGQPVAARGAATESDDGAERGLLSQLPHSWFRLRLDRSVDRSDIAPAASGDGGAASLDVRGLGLLCSAGGEPAQRTWRAIGHGQVAARIDVLRLPPLDARESTELKGPNGPIKGAPHLTESETLELMRLGGRFIRSALVAIDEPGDPEQPSERLKARAIRRVEFLRELLETPSPSSGQRREEYLLERLLTEYEQLAVEDGNRGDYELDEALLKHVAVISGPVELGVLADLPGVNKAAATGSTQTFDDFKQRVEKVAASLARLEARGLIFQVTPRADTTTAKDQLDGKEPDAADPTFRRYGVHPLVQSYFFRKIGSPHIEFGDSRLFKVSLWGMQPTDLPAPTRDSYEYLDGLLRSLIDYPTEAAEFDAAHDAAGHGEVMLPLERWQMRYGPSARDLMVCRLRAALSLVRTVFSLAVISRYGDFGDRRTKPYRIHGYLEAFRVRLVWMLYMASVLDAPPPTPAAAPRPTTQPSPDQAEPTEADAAEPARLDAFYPGEQAWLLNECGLVSLIQGRMDDAAVLFERALRANAEGEGEGGAGPNAMRIRLNRAMASIDRGALTGANDALRGLRTVNQEDPEVFAMTETGLALLAHLKGRKAQAERRYARAAVALKGVVQAGRGLSIVYRHWGDLLRSHGEFTGAAEKIDAARAEAQSASQYDLVHWCLLAEANLIMIVPDASAQDLARANKLLAEVETYARTMEIHSMTTDMLAARAVLSLRQGETRAAGDAAVEGASIASLNGLRLRTISGLIRIGHISKRRGYVESGERLIQSARAACDRIGYQPGLNRAVEALIE